ncbi:MAG: nucleotidyl transferase AbiEii/AbiGii toxin family protein [Cyclobacteriaceae bacterium]|nr:nucleotidyl transferase AbiEii/AbiGii toxin family protein [Cyclobacteriaceae bacterium]
MNNISNPFLNEFHDEFQVIEKCCKDLRIDFYVIGAIAKQIWFFREKISTSRTKDIDFAVFITNEEQFSELKTRLIEHYQFRDSKDNPFVLHSPNNKQIDILPFGQLEVEDGVIVPGKGLSKIKVNGLKEVYLESVVEVKIFEQNTLKIATLAGIFLLKLIAFDDRPEFRGKDLDDCVEIILHYFELEIELIYESHYDLFGYYYPDQNKLLGARVLGREISKPIAKNDDLTKRITEILQMHIDLGVKSEFISKMTQSGKLDVKTCKNCLIEILNGIHDKS